MYNVRSTLYNLEPLVTTLTVDSAQSSRLDKVTDELDVAKIFAELEHTGLQIGSAAAPLVYPDTHTPRSRRSQQSWRKKE